MSQSRGKEDSHYEGSFGDSFSYIPWTSEQRKGSQPSVGLSVDTQKQEQKQPADSLDSKSSANAPASKNDTR